MSLQNCREVRLYKRYFVYLFFKLDINVFLLFFPGSKPVVAMDPVSTLHVKFGTVKPRIKEPVG
jgi:hypothetical protein